MLNITVPFNARNHGGKWMVVGEDGYAMARQGEGCNLREIWALHSVALQMGGAWTAEELSQLMTRYSQIGGVVNAIASPIPG